MLFGMIEYILARLFSVDLILLNLLLQYGVSVFVTTIPFWSIHSPFL